MCRTLEGRALPNELPMHYLDIRPIVLERIDDESDYWANSSVSNRLAICNVFMSLE